MRGMFKSSQTDKMIEAAYMTGILPIKGYGSNILLVGINYDEKTKKHTCKIEKINKVQAG